MEPHAGGMEVHLGCSLQGAGGGRRAWRHRNRKEHAISACSAEKMEGALLRRGGGHSMTTAVHTYHKVFPPVSQKALNDGENCVFLKEQQHVENKKLSCG